MVDAPLLALEVSASCLYVDFEGETMAIYDIFFKKNVGFIVSGMSDKLRD